MIYLKENEKEFIINALYSKLFYCFRNVKLGILTMENEHFGISVVEMIASEMIIMSHNSTGPRLDIIRKKGNLDKFVTRQ